MPAYGTLSPMPDFLPPQYNKTLWVGNHNPWAFGFFTNGTSTTTEYPLAGIRVNVTIYSGDERLVGKSTAATPVPTVTVTGSRIDTDITPDDTRIIAAAVADGVKPRYEVEFWDGTRETTWVWGTVTLKGGANDDE